MTNIIAHPPETAGLITLRDILRYAVTRFGAAKLSFGHGTTTALDEAAFLLLTHLHLPIDNLAPWLDARLTPSEQRSALDLIEARITTRKPAPYLVNSAWIGPFEFYVDERVIVPRSFLGELFNSGLEDRIGADLAPTRILDLCTGSGCLAIMAASAYPDARVAASDLSPAALAVARINVDTYKLADRIDLIESDLFARITSGPFDLIVSNPPYVTEAAVASFPPEYAAEPVTAHLGGPDGMDLVRRILFDAPNHLTADGWLIMEIGQGRATIETDLPDLPFMWLDTDDSEGEVFALPASALKVPKPKSTTTTQSRRPKSS